MKSSYVPMFMKNQRELIIITEMLVPFRAQVKRLLPLPKIWTSNHSHRSNFPTSCHIHKAMVWKISPWNPKFYNFSLQIIKISWGWVKKYPGRRLFGLLFTADQKHARVRSGQGPFLLRLNKKISHRPVRWDFDLVWFNKSWRLCPKSPQFSNLSIFSTF